MKMNKYCPWCHEVIDELYENGYPVYKSNYDEIFGHKWCMEKYDEEKQSSGEEYTLEDMERYYIENGEKDAELAEEFMGVPTIKKQQEIIEIQQQIIDEYESKVRYLNKILMDTYKGNYPNELRSFALDINDCLMDQSKIKLLSEKLNEFEEGELNE